MVPKHGRSPAHHQTTRVGIDEARSVLCIAFSGWSINENEWSMQFTIEYIINSGVAGVGENFSVHMQLTLFKSPPPSFYFLFRARRSGLTASVLVAESNDLCSSPDRDAGLNSWARHFTLTVPQLTRCIYGFGEFTAERQLVYCCRNLDKPGCMGHLALTQTFSII